MMSFAEGIKATDFRNLDAEIKRTLRYSAKAVVGLGFLLRRMAEQKLWAECYDSFDDYLREELHMDYTMASRFIGINKKYSADGNSLEPNPRWADYSQAVLIEMLSMPPELEEKVTPDMTVRQVRELKRQAREAMTKPKKEAGPVKEKRCDTYPGYICNIGEIVKKHFTKGGNIEGCVGCCAICLKKRACKYACEAVLAMGVIELADIPEEQTHVIPAREDTGKAPRDEILDAEYRELETVGEVATSQLITSAYGPEKTERREGSLLTTPGCGGDCVYRCERSRLGQAAESKENNPEISETAPDDAVDELTEIKDILKWEQRTLMAYLELGGIPKPAVFRQRIIVTAIEAMVHDLESTDLEPQAEAVAQPELPTLKNDNQRKEWLRAYKDWGLWYRDENIGAEYYKYDFDNGARLIAEVYPGDYEPYFLHLVGGPKPPKGAYGTLKWARHEKYSKHPNCETDLVEFLKEVQKK